MYRLLLLLSIATYSGHLMAERLIDPTKPLSGVVTNGDAMKPAQGYILQSVFVSGTKKRAIINNKKVVIGDRVGEYQVTSIQRNKVTLENDADTLELHLFRQAVIK